MFWLAFLASMLDVPTANRQHSNPHAGACCSSCARGGPCEGEPGAGEPALPPAWSTHRLPPMRGRLQSNVAGARLGRLSADGSVETVTVRCCCGQPCDEQGCTQTSCIPGIGCKVIHSWSCATERASREEKGN